MKESEFWSCIDKLDWKNSGDDDLVIEPVVSLLSSLDVGEIFEFETILSQKLFELDTKEHAKNIGDDAYVDDDEYFSVDAFLYARCVVVANGNELFDQVVAKPKKFPKDMEFEAILGIASAAFERKTGNAWDFHSPVSYETYSNKAGWA